MKNLIDDTILEPTTEPVIPPAPDPIEVTSSEIVEPEMKVSKGGGDKTLINVLIIAGVLLLLFALLKMYFDAKDKIENS